MGERRRGGTAVGDTERLDEIAAPLYVIPPAAFTAARGEAAAAAPAGLRGRVTALRKPTVAAWAVNLLVHDGQLGEAVELTRALQEAQDDMDAGELQRLGGQRRRLVAGLARRAAELADAAGTALSAAVREDVERTINAAVVDPAAAAAVLTGRLVRPVAPGGLDAESLAAAVAGSVPGVAAPPPPDRDDLAERRARKAAAQAARTAERAASEAHRVLARADAAVEKARERADLLHERVDELRRELGRVAADAEQADARLERLEDERSDAATAARDAERAADRARAAAAPLSRTDTS